MPMTGTRSQPWLVGANFIPSDAINELEMFQAETFDPKLIDKELGLARRNRDEHDASVSAGPVMEAESEGFHATAGYFSEYRGAAITFDRC